MGLGVWESEDLGLWSFLRIVGNKLFQVNKKHSNTVPLVPDLSYYKDNVYG